MPQVCEVPGAAEPAGGAGQERPEAPFHPRHRWRGLLRCVLRPARHGGPARCGHKALPSWIVLVQILGNVAFYQSVTFSEDTAADCVYDNLINKYVFLSMF